MSITSNQIVSIWVDGEDLISRHIPEYYRGTTKLDRLSQKIVRDAVMLWYLVTWDSLSSWGSTFSKADQNRWIRSIGEIGVGELVDLLKESNHLLISGDFDSYDAFKQHLRKSFPNVGAIFAPIKEIVHHWFHFNDTDALSLVYSWTLFISRLNLQGLTDLEDEALSKYLLIEENLPEDGFTSEESSLLQTWFPRSLEDMAFLTEHHRPQHGPGDTADAGRVQQLKYLHLDSDARSAMLTRRVYGDSNPYPRKSVKSLKRLSKTIFVPKSLGSYRTISMEPATIMWHQKGVRNAWMDLMVSRKHYLLRRFRPEHQQPNRDLAFEGSLDGSFSTIDLSSASDTVSWALVKS